MSEKEINEKNYLGVDWGEKRIGLALADPETRLALPFKIVNSLDELLLIIKEENIGLVVLGLPLKLSGQVDPNSPFHSFYQALEERSPHPVVLSDERLSSRTDDLNSKKNKDSQSACLLLQNYLDFSQN